MTEEYARTIKASSTIFIKIKIEVTHLSCQEKEVSKACVSWKSYLEVQQIWGGLWNDPKSKIPHRWASEMGFHQLSTCWINF